MLFIDMLTTNKRLGIYILVRSACSHLESTLLFQDTAEVHPVPGNVDLIPPRVPLLFRRSEASPVPTAVSPPRGRPSPLQTLPTPAPARILRCYTYRSCVLPPQRPRHRYLHHHVKTKFLNLRARGCRPPKASSPAPGLLRRCRTTSGGGSRLQHLWGSPSRENPFGKPSSGARAAPQGAKPGRGRLPPASSLLPPGSADRTLASSSPPTPAPRSPGGAGAGGG